MSNNRNHYHTLLPSFPGVMATIAFVYIAVTPASCAKMCSPVIPALLYVLLGLGAFIYIKVPHEKAHTVLLGRLELLRKYLILRIICVLTFIACAVYAFIPFEHTGYDFTIFGELGDMMHYVSPIMPRPLMDGFQDAGDAIRVLQDVSLNIAEAYESRDTALLEEAKATGNEIMETMERSYVRLKILVALGVSNMIIRAVLNFLLMRYWKRNIKEVNNVTGSR